MLMALLLLTAIFLTHRRNNHILRPENAQSPIAGHFSSSEPTPLPEVTADMILIEKRMRRMTLFYKGKALKRYHISLGSEPVGKKTTEGDGRTPEGVYIVDSRKADSKYHRALHISYPDEGDKRQAAARGVSPGSDIMIHGIMDRKGKFLKDWTLGCIAVTNREIDEIWRLTPNGTPIEIVP